MKKLIAILLTMVMTLSLATAFATDSKTSDDVAAVVDIAPAAEKTASSAPAAVSNLVITIIENDQQAFELEKIAEFVKTAPVVEYFPAEAQEKIENKDSELTELTGLLVSGYTSAMGDVEVIFRFDTAFDPEQKVVALVGLYDSTVIDENTTADWEVVSNVEVLDNGDVKILFPADLLAKLNVAPAAVIAILATPIAQ